MTNWQEELVDKLQSQKPGELKIFASGRRTGKSHYAKYMQQWYQMIEEAKPPYKVVSRADVDGNPWFTVSCKKEVSTWLRENYNEDTDWLEHIDHNWNLLRDHFDMPEQVLFMLKLRWGE